MRKLVDLAAALAIVWSLVSPAPVLAQAPVVPYFSTNGNPPQAPVTPSNPLPVTGSVSPTTGTFTDRSGSITAGGTSQTLASANTARKQIVIENPSSATGQNISAAESLYINFTGAGGVDNGTSIELVPGGSYVSGTPVSTQAITVNAATTGHVFIAKEM